MKPHHAGINFVTGGIFVAASQNAKDQAGASGNIDLSMRLTGELC
jgi:hypothetical protein